ncbi:flippase [Candidatus Parcubacteria bacterium]|nr:flippase [Candidatus Parcubacteria bacterium]
MDIKNFTDIKSLKSLFFDNKTVRQTILKNTFWLAAAEGVSRLLGLILIIYIARILGATEFGKFTFALSFVSMLAIISEFGLSEITIREFSRDKETEKEYSAILSLKILLSIGALLLILISSFFITPDPVIQKIILLLGVYVLISNFFSIIYAFLRARQRMEYECGAKIFQSLIIVSIVLFILFKFPSIENLSYGYLFTNLIALSFILLFFHFRIHSLNLSWNKAVWQKFFKLSWPLGLAAVFGTIFINVASVMMGCLGQITETGWYNAARRIVGVTIIPATLIFMSFFPVLSKFFKESNEKLQRAWNHYMEIMIILAMPIMVGGLFLAPRIIDFLYGSSFAPSIFAFQILIIMAGINFLYNPYLMILIVFNQQKKYLWINLIAAITNVALNLILIPIFSLYGAAVAAVITYLVILFLGIEFSKRFALISLFDSRLFKILLIGIFSSIIMFVVISQSVVYNLNVILTIIIGILVYFAALFLFYKFLFRINLLRKIYGY